jgi:hypothetical protein
MAITCTAEERAALDAKAGKIPETGPGVGAFHRDA